MAKPDLAKDDEKDPKRSMRLRVYPGVKQEAKLGAWLYIAHGFRNEAVSYLKSCRVARAKWVAKHPVLAKEWIPEEFDKKESSLCSSWLTEQLELARALACKWFLVSSNKKTIGEEFARAWSHLSRQERDEMLWRAHQTGVFLEWLLPPRTVLDQVVQDLGKTITKAVADRTENKTRRVKGLKPVKVAGFPTYRKWSYATGIRLQVVASKNKDFREGWRRGELVVPRLGYILIRERGYAWPQTPAKMITFSRDQAGEWHITFAMEEGEGLGSRGRRLAKESKRWEPLPLDAKTGLPAAEGLDMSLTDMAVSNQHGKLGRQRHLKRQEAGLRFQNKSVSRKKKGSGRWTKSLRELGRRHNKIATTRKAYNLEKAQEVASRSAIVCTEDLQQSFMLQNKRLAKSAHDLGWGQFLTFLEEECAKRGHLLIKTGRFDPSTQTCPTLGCDYKNTELKNNLNIRTWVCPVCQMQHDRDDAASNNIQAMAIARYLERSTGAESVPGMHKIHPELASFIAHGGMTALLQPVCKGSRRVEVKPCPGIAVPMNREKHLSSGHPVWNG